MCGNVVALACALFVVVSRSLSSLMAPQPQAAPTLRVRVRGRGAGGAGGRLTRAQSSEGARKSRRRPAVNTARGEAWAEQTRAGTHRQRTTCGSRCIGAPPE